MNVVLAELKRTAARNARQRDALQAWWFRAAVFAGAVALLLRHVVYANVADIDMFHEMALIREALALGAFPRNDLYAYTPTVSPVVHHEWATGAVLYVFVVLTGWGWNAVKLLQFALLAGIAYGSYVCTTRRGAHPLTAALMVGVGATLFAPGLAAVRAQMFTYLFTVLMLLLLDAHQRLRGRLLLLWLPLFLLWVNMHGGFVVGLGLFGLYTAERVARDIHAGSSWISAAARHRYLLIALPAMALLVLATPYGIDYPGYVWSAIRMDRPLIVEWAPLWDPRVKPTLVITFCLSLIIGLYAVLKSEHRRRFVGLPLLLAAAFFTIQHQRMAPVYSVIWFCYVPAYLAHTPLETLILRLARRYSALVALGAVVLAGMTGDAMVRERSWVLTFPSEGSGRTFPIGAVRHLDASGFAGDLMTPYNMGAYVSWMLYPRVRVSLDSRYEVAYPTEMAHELIAFYDAADGWEKTLERYPPDAVLVPINSPINPLLADHPDWRLEYRDGGFALFYSGTGSVVR